MCVIVYKPIDAKLNFEYLDACSIANPDSCGYMTIKNESVYMSRYLKSVDMIRELRLLPADASVIIHFRIATSGKINIQNAHPMPITRGYRVYRRKVISSDIGLTHNGTCVLKSMSKKKLKRYSDTRLLSQMILPRYLKDMNKLDKFMNKLTMTSHSKFAVMHKSGKVKLYGEFDIVDGCHYSNLNWIYYSDYYADLWRYDTYSYNGYMRYLPYKSTYKSTYKSKDKSNMDKYIPYNSDASVNYSGIREYCQLCNIELTNADNKSDIACNACYDANLSDKHAINYLNDAHPYNEFCDNCTGNVNPLKECRVGTFVLCESCANDTDTLDMFYSLEFKNKS